LAEHDEKREDERKMMASAVDTFIVVCCERGSGSGYWLSSTLQSVLVMSELLLTVVNYQLAPHNIYLFQTVEGK